MKRSHAQDGNSSSRPLFRLIIPRAPCPNVFSHIAMPPLGALYVATAVSEDGRWDVEVIDELNWRRSVSKRELADDPVADHRDLQSRRPADAVGFYGGLTSTIHRLFEVSRFYRDQGMPRVAGGAHVDALPVEAIREGVDVVVHGEGEETVLEILEAWSGKGSLRDIRGISFEESDGVIVRTDARVPICDLDALPIPDFDLLVESRRPITLVPFERTRGCNYRCEFCIVNDRFGPSRSATPERVAAELEQRVDSGMRHFFCVDDNFAQDRKETIRLLGLIQDFEKRRGTRLDLTVQVRSSVGRDEELMREMRAAGVRLLCIGLESPIKEELERMAKRQTPEQIEKDVRNLHSHGFTIHGMFIFGYPLEDPAASTSLTLRERADRYISFIKRTAIDSIQVLKPVPIPGSRLARRLMDQDRILPLTLVGWDKYDGNFLTFLPDCNISASELQKQANRIMRRFYSPLSFLRFPVLVFATPVEIVRLGFTRAREFARHRADRTQAAVDSGVERVSALRVGFREAGVEIQRLWRNAVTRTFGSIVVSNSLKDGQHARFLKMLSRLQSSTTEEGR